MTPAHADEPQSTPLIVVENIRRSFSGVPVLCGVDLTVGEGEVVAVIGPSGSGKTTLIRTINALETIDHGRITVDGKVIQDITDGRHRLDPKTARLARGSNWEWSFSGSISFRT